MRIANLLNLQLVALKSPWFSSSGFPTAPYSFLILLLPTVITLRLNSQMSFCFPFRPDEILSVLDTFFVWVVFWVLFVCTYLKRTTWCFDRHMPGDLITTVTLRNPSISYRGIFVCMVRTLTSALLANLLFTVTTVLSIRCPALTHPAPETLRLDQHVPISLAPSPQQWAPLPPGWLREPPHRSWLSCSVSLMCLAYSSHFIL